jgi:hypothetical protein
MSPRSRRSAVAKRKASAGGRRVGLRAYARHRGVTLSTVQKAIAEGRITRGKDGKLNVQEADRDWTANTRPTADGDATNTLAEANRRKALADAELKELELAERRGELVPLEVHRVRVEALVSRLNATVRGLRGRWAPHVIGIESAQEAQIRLGPLINELLRELTETEPEKVPHGKRRSLTVA